MVHEEVHRVHRVGWLRAAVLGANDGIVSTASLIVGVTAANSSHEAIVLAGFAGLVAGAMSMAAGEYVSVSSQADTERADLAIEERSLAQNFDLELRELAEIYERRGLDPNLAHQVADQLMEHDALAAHARDDIGISATVGARPVQAAVSSASAFVVGAAVPLAVTLALPLDRIMMSVAATSLVSLAVLGGLAARAGGASIAVGAARVTFWGAFAMAITAGVGRLFNIVA